MVSFCLEFVQKNLEIYGIHLLTLFLINRVILKLFLIRSVLNLPPDIEGKNQMGQIFPFIQYIVFMPDLLVKVKATI